MALTSLCRTPIERSRKALFQGDAAVAIFWLTAASVFLGAQAIIPSTASASQVHGALTNIDRLFRLDMLQSNREFVEHMIGPAKYTSAASGDSAISVRMYVVDGCNVEVGYKDDAVTYLGLKGVSSHCSFPLSRFIPHSPPTRVGELSRLTFGAFETDVGPGTKPNFYRVECLASCGNSAEPSVSLYHSGAHSDEFIDIVIEQEYPYSDRTTDLGLSKLEDILLKMESSQYLSSGTVACDPKYQPLHKRLFETAAVKNVFVGFNLGSHAPNCHVP